jgi:hypothetical protein
MMRLRQQEAEQSPVEADQKKAKKKPAGGLHMFLLSTLIYELSDCVCQPYRLSGARLWLSQCLRLTCASEPDPWVLRGHGHGTCSHLGSLSIPSSLLNVRGVSAGAGFMLGKGTAVLKSALEQAAADDGMGTLAASMGQVSLNGTASAADGTTSPLQKSDQAAQRTIQVLCCARLKICLSTHPLAAEALHGMFSASQESASEESPIAFLRLLYRVSSRVSLSQDHKSA